MIINRGIPINQPVEWNERGILNIAHMRCTPSGNST